MTLLKYAVGVSSGAATLAAVATLVLGWVAVHDLHRLQIQLGREVDGFKAATDDMWKDLLLVQSRHGLLRPAVADAFRSAAQASRKTKRQIERTCQCSATNRCPPGSPGSPGRSGEDGMPGMPGGVGKAGRDGISGPLPVDEAGCMLCPGPPGPDGAAGGRGAPGPRGTSPQEPEFVAPDPPRGPPGDDGDPGTSGRPGNRGPPGRPGDDSFRGVSQPGAKGPPGNPGPPGLPGPLGQDAEGFGPPGPEGPTGLVGGGGNSGSPGRVGSPGDPGGPGRDGQYCPCPARSFVLTNLHARDEVGELTPFLKLQPVPHIDGGQELELPALRSRFDASAAPSGRPSELETNFVWPDFEGAEPLPEIPRLPLDVSETTVWEGQLDNPVSTSLLPEEELEIVTVPPPSDLDYFLLPDDEEKEKPPTTFVHNFEDQLRLKFS